MRWVTAVWLGALLFALAPVRAGASTGVEEGWDGSLAAGTGGMGALAALPPAGPILAGAEGATDSGTANILLSALYGGLAGAVIGLAVALIENGNYARDIGIGAGVGILVGAVLGAAHVFGDERGPLPTTDGLGSTDRDPVITSRTLALGGTF